MDIFIPFIGMMILTMTVWIFMYARRLSWIHANEIEPDTLSTPEKLNAIIPEEINFPSNNLKNLFELPILFYALVIYLSMAQQIDNIHIYCAYIFFILRCLHSVIHCTINNVNFRFFAYFLSSIPLWVMVVRSAISIT